jgi:hypothetical protein
MWKRTVSFTVIAIGIISKTLKDWGFERLDGSTEQSDREFKEELHPRQPISRVGRDAENRQISQGP